MKGRRWIIETPLSESFTENSFKLVEEDLPALKDGEVLIQALYHTVDPYMRGFATPLNDTPIGQQVGKVLESKNKDYPVDSLVLAMTGWREKAVVNPSARSPYHIQRYTGERLVHDIPDLKGLSPSLLLGSIGMPGLTAYFGVEKLQPKAGDVVLVNAAAGAVGSIVGQIAKIKGCTVIGAAGAQEKCDWLKKVGFDHAFNYKTTSVKEALEKLAPNGVDCYFDTVGGEFTNAVLDKMNGYGRICVTGMISRYTEGDGSKSVADFLGSILMKELKIEGNLVYSNEPRFFDAKRQLVEWISQGKIQSRETIWEGFEKMPSALISLFKGDNTGKVIVKV